MQWSGLKHFNCFVYQGPEKKMKEEQDDMERTLREEEEKSKTMDSEGDLENEDEAAAEEGESEDDKQTRRMSCKGQSSKSKIHLYPYGLWPFFKQPFLQIWSASF